ncbi:hypothetical protein J2Z21_006536 [Streptomyces griseochromogenes]|uniref:Integral membrane protein n=1 Tax=Streptomyces griseochromogenes TaxID=68214 RepID=A0A1B1B9L2_9ACTN|nr:hypothetical protein [Streptomyces griseochromogenes]ANP55505.1 hypothetical protein AVL59_43175 [Streptomyces griseochromogenes]MBP2053543.1 hypothetical protein [Streptomyces griseochromogenes]
MSSLDAPHTDLKKDLDATVRARRELGEEYDSALVDSFLEKVEQRIDDAVERRMRRHLAEQRMSDARGARRPKSADTWADRFGFAIVSLVLAIPLSAIGGALAGMSGTVAAWVGIVGVNAAQAVRLNPELITGRRDRSAEQD